mmetsp:Transcript_68865/g.109241  ORF Transcript_68865/g.109241 Transcript_68865/m.109241 type:complete len:117 (-) Transcript_68865:221-571(-)
MRQRRQQNLQNDCDTTEEEVDRILAGEFDKAALYTEAELRDHIARSEEKQAKLDLAHEDEKHEHTEILDFRDKLWSFVTLALSVIILLYSFYVGFSWCQTSGLAVVARFMNHAGES